MERVMLKRRMQSERHINLEHINSSAEDADKLHSNHHIKLRNLYIERMQRKESSSPRRLATEGDVDDDGCTKDRSREAEKLLKIEKEWNYIKLNLSSTTDNTISTHLNPEQKHTKITDWLSIKHIGQSHQYRAPKANKSVDEITLDEGNEKAKIHKVKYFNTNCKYNRKSYKRVVPVTKITLLTSGVYINSRASESLYTKAKLASDSVERQKNFSYADVHDSIDMLFHGLPADHANRPKQFTISQSPITNKGLYNPKVNFSSKLQNGKSAKVSQIREERNIAKCTDCYRQMLLKGIKQSAS